jgi:hypothetical protein
MFVSEQKSWAEVASITHTVGVCTVPQGTGRGDHSAGSPP